MTPFKTILRSESGRRFLCWLGAHYIRLVRASGRWTVVRGATAERLWNEGKPFIVGFWHGRLLMLPAFWTRRRVLHILVSGHPDGQLVARTSGHFGIRSIAGSTTRGGGAALRAMLKALKDGDCVGIAPDGPRGPRMRASDGIVTVARMSGAPILPVAYGSARRRILSTWDRFAVAWPFASGVIVWGTPITVARDADGEALEAARRQVEDSLNAITAEADGRCGRAPVEPAPATEGASP